MTQYEIGEDYFGQSTLKKHSLIYICVRCRGRGLEMWQVGCFRNTISCYECPGEKTVIQNGLMTTSFPSFILVLLLSGKCVLLRDQRVSSIQDSGIQDFRASRCFQALKQNWMWVRAGTLLVWERGLENNTRDFPEKSLLFFLWNMVFPRVRKSLSGCPVFSADIAICYQLQCFHGFVLITAGISHWIWKNSHFPPPHLNDKMLRWGRRSPHQAAEDIMLPELKYLSPLELWMQNRFTSMAKGSSGPQLNDLLSNSGSVSIMLSVTIN